MELPFNGSERIAAVLVQEGDRVKQGQLLARLETGRLAPQVARPRPMWPCSSRPSIACIMATVRRRLLSARPMSRPRPLIPPTRGRNTSDYNALSDSSSGKAVSRQDMDAAKAALDNAEADWR